MADYRLLYSLLVPMFTAKGTLVQFQVFTPVAFTSNNILVKTGMSDEDLATQLLKFISSLLIPYTSSV